MKTARTAKPAAVVALALALLGIGAPVQGQVGVTPTHYTHTIEGLNKIGTRLFKSSWITEYTDVHTMTPNRLVVSHTVYYASVKTFWQIPKKIEHLFTYRGGFGLYIMTSAQRIEWLAPMADGSGWIATTNNYDLDPTNPISLQWSPEMTGRDVTGNEYWRTIETGTGLDCMCENFAATPRLLKLPCVSGSVGFDYMKRFAVGERQFITIGVDTIDRDLDAFRFDLNYITDELTL